MRLARKASRKARSYGNQSNRINRMRKTHQCCQIEHLDTERFILALALSIYVSLGPSPRSRKRIMYGQAFISKKAYDLDLDGGGCVSKSQREGHDRKDGLFNVLYHFNQVKIRISRLQMSVRYLVADLLCSR